MNGREVGLNRLIRRLAAIVLRAICFDADFVWPSRMFGLWRKGWVSIRIHAGRKVWNAGVLHLAWISGRLHYRSWLERRDCLLVR